MRSYRQILKVPWADEREGIGEDVKTNGDFHKHKGMENCLFWTHNEKPKNQQGKIEGKQGV